MGNKKGTKGWSTTPNVMWNKKMVLTLVQAWETKSPVEIAEELSTDTIEVTPQNVNHMVQVLRSKGVFIPHKRKNGVYQVLVDEFLQDHPEYKKKEDKK